MEILYAVWTALALVAMYRAHVERREAREWKALAERRAWTINGWVIEATRAEKRAEVAERSAVEATKQLIESKNAEKRTEVSIP